MGMKGDCMIVEYDKFNIGAMVMNVELVDKVPDGYYFIQRQNGYDLYRKDEIMEKDTNHYYIGIKSE